MSESLLRATAIEWHSLNFKAPGERSEKEATLDNKRALNGFLASVERRAFRMAEMATRNPDDAMDIVQDAMFKLVERYGAHPEAEWGPLFQTVLQSRITDWYRRQTVKHRLFGWLQRKPDEDDEDVLEQIADERSLNPAEQDLLRRDTEQIAAAISRLPLRQQQAFLLRAWEEMSVEQTARVMGCSEGSVKTHYFRALQALRGYLKA